MFVFQSVHDIFTGRTFVVYASLASSSAVCLNSLLFEAVYCVQLVLCLFCSGNVPASPSAAELASSYFSSFLQPFSNSSTIVPDAIDASAPFGVSLSSQIACDDLICIVALALVQAAPTHFIRCIFHSLFRWFAID
jgi:hypothetical protein